jgi:Phenylalanyl-tRNA synthetase beta subunit
VLRPERTRALVGLDVEDARQREILESIGFDVADDWTVTVPTWRARDVTREVDVIEEVARFVLEEVPFTLPRRDATFGRLTRWQQLRRLAEDVLVGCGFAEAYTPTFVPGRGGSDGAAAAGAALRRGGGAADEPPPEPRRRGARERRRRQHGDRALRDRAGLSPRRRRASGRALARRGNRRRWLRRGEVGGRAAVRRAEARAGVRARDGGVPPPGQVGAGRGRAGSASCIRRP